jgi:hypothetical protein
MGNPQYDLTVVESVPGTVSRSVPDYRIKIKSTDSVTGEVLVDQEIPFLEFLARGPAEVLPILAECQFAQKVLMAELGTL